MKIDTPYDDSYNINFNCSSRLNAGSFEKLPLLILLTIIRRAI